MSNRFSPIAPIVAKSLQGERVEVNPGQNKKQRSALPPLSSLGSERKATRRDKIESQTQCKIPHDM